MGRRPWPSYPPRDRLPSDHVNCLQPSSTRLVTVGNSLAHGLTGLAGGRDSSSVFRRAAPTCLVLLAAALAASGCGSGSPSTASTRTSSFTAAKVLSRAQVIAQADAICRQLNVQLRAHVGSGESPRQLAQEIPPRVTLEQRSVQELGKLAAPSSVASALQTIVVYRRALAQELAQLGDDAKLDDTAAIRRLAASKAQSHLQLRRFATAAGFSDCAHLG
jgi:hypothetical protein